VKGWTKHHRKPKSLDGSNDPANISLVRHVQHHAWHTLFTNLTVWEIVRLINDVWIDPEFEVVVRKKEPPVS